MRDEDNSWISYCYFSRVVGEVGETSFSKNELSKGFKLKWIPFVESLNILMNDEPENVLGEYIQQRDMAFIRKGEEIYEQAL